MNQKEIRELIEFLVEKDIAEFELERGDMKLHIKRGVALQPAPVLAVAPAVASAPAIPAPTVPAVAPPSAVAARQSGTDESAGAAAKAPSGPAAEAVQEAGLFIVKSPIVGTFYEAPSPGAPPFFKIGDTVQEGQVLCIIEAMKLMNELEAEVAGEIVRTYVESGQPVEYGQSLFAIKPSRGK